MLLSHFGSSSSSASDPTDIRVDNPLNKLLSEEISGILSGGNVVELLAFNCEHLHASNIKGLRRRRRRRRQRDSMIYGTLDAVFSC